MEEILAKYFAGEASAEEKQQVRDWRGESEENARSFMDHKTAWLSTASKSIPDQVLLNSIIGSEEENMEENHEEVKIVPLWQQRSFQVAASAIIVVGILFYLLQPNYEDQPWGETLLAKTEFSLPDGSEVTVQKGGSITMGDFKETREVTITGKAYFDVERDEKKPFIIETDGATVRVLGTSFVVNSNSEKKTTEVMVESGLVALGQSKKYFGNNPMEIKLQKGEMGIIAVGERGIKKKKISDANYLAWQNQVLTFSRTRMSNVGDILNEVYGLDVAFENTTLKNCYLTAKYNKKSAEEVVKLVAETFNMTYEMKGNQVTFKGEGCQ